MKRFYWMTLPVVLGSATFGSMENAPAPAGWLQASVDTFRLTLVTGGAEQPIGQLIDALEVVEDQGRMVYRRIRQYQNERMFGDREATVVDRFPDVRPISHSVVDRSLPFGPRLPHCGHRYCSPPASSTRLPMIVDSFSI